MPRPEPEPGSIPPVETYGTYRGTTTVEFLREGERRSAQSGVVVAIDEPIQHEDGTETNPLNLHFSTTPDIVEAGAPYEGMYSVSSAGVYFDLPNAPGIDLTPPDTWLEQHWHLTFDNGRFAGVLFSNNRSGNSIWYEIPGRTVDFGYGPIVFDDIVVPTGFRVGATIEGTINEAGVTASIAGSTPAIDAFEITVAAERSQI